MEFVYIYDSMHDFHLITINCDGTHVQCVNRLLGNKVHVAVYRDQL
jgi:hypothetical protein